MGVDNFKVVVDSVQKFIFWQINRLNKVLFFRFNVFLVTPHDRTIGNTAEEIHFALILSRRLEKRAIFLQRRSFLGAPKIPNHRVFEIRPANEKRVFFWEIVRSFLSFFLTLQGHFFGLLYYFWINSLRLPISVVNRFLFRKNVPVFYRHYRNCLFHQYVGHELIWRHGFAKERFEQFNFDLGLPSWKQEVEIPVPISFSLDEERFCRKSLEKLGLGDGDWFVCLHNRESGYHRDSPDLRNSSIVKYELGIKEITEAGGWVIRMGDRTMTRLPSMERVIDLPFTEFKSDLMDLYLVKNCRFYLGQNSGLVDVAYLFGKRCALVNTTEWAIGFPRLKNSRVIFKHFYSLKWARYLSVAELLSQPFSVLDLHHFQHEYRVQENTPEEIAELVVEVMAEPNDFNSLQSAFVQNRRKQLLGWLKEELYSDPEQDRIFKYRLYSRIDGCAGTAGSSYLERNWDRNSLNY